MRLIPINLAKNLKINTKSLMKIFNIKFNHFSCLRIRKKKKKKFRTIKKIKINNFIQIFIISFMYK